MPRVLPRASAGPATDGNEGRARRRGEPRNQEPEPTTAGGRPRRAAAPAPAAEPLPAATTGRGRGRGRPRGRPPGGATGRVAARAAVNRPRDSNVGGGDDAARGEPPYGCAFCDLRARAVLRHCPRCDALAAAGGSGGDDSTPASPVRRFRIASRRDTAGALQQGALGPCPHCGVPAHHPLLRSVALSQGGINPGRARPSGAARSSRLIPTPAVTRIPS